MIILDSLLDQDLSGHEISKNSRNFCKKKQPSSDKVHPKTWHKKVFVICFLGQRNFSTCVFSKRKKTIFSINGGHFHSHLFLPAKSEHWKKKKNSSWIYTGAFFSNIVFTVSSCLFQKEKAKTFIFVTVKLLQQRKKTRQPTTSFCLFWTGFPS